MGIPTSLFPILAVMYDMVTLQALVLVRLIKKRLLLMLVGSSLLKKMGEAHYRYTQPANLTNQQMAILSLNRRSPFRILPV